MKLSPLRVMLLALLLLVGFAGQMIGPVHAASDFSITNKFVVNGAVSSNIGVPNGGRLSGKLTVANTIPGASNSVTFSYTLNTTGPELPVVDFSPPTIALPVASPTPDAANATMYISVDPAVFHGGYNITVAATNGVNIHYINYLVKVYSIAVTVDAQNTGALDTTPSAAASQALTFKVGVMVANATTTGGSLAECTIAFPCGLPVFGWQFGLTYDPTVLVPQGDPDPTAIPGNPSGLYVDGAQSMVLFGGQTNIGEGTASWASLAAGQEAFTVVNQRQNTILVAFTLVQPLSAAFLASSTGRFLLASISFELVRKPTSTTLVTISDSDLAFADQLGNPTCSCVISTTLNQGGTASETITNSPPTAILTVTPLPPGDPSCRVVYSLDTSGCSDTAFLFNASSSSDPQGSPLTYVWDFGDGSRDSPAEATALCPSPDADLNCSQGVSAIHDFGTVALMTGGTVPASFLATLRVADALGVTGSARDGSGNPISNAQPSHTSYSAVIPQKDFNITISPSQFSFTVGSTDSSATAHIGLVSVNNFSGTVFLSETISPNQQGAPVVFLGNTTINLQTGGFNQSSLQVIVKGGTTLPGNYLVIVSGTSGPLSHYASLQLMVVKPPDQPPIANFTATPRSPIVGNPVTLDGSASFDPDGFVQSWSWNFGDGQSTSFSPFSTIQHNYNFAGDYTVTLSVMDNAGLTGSVSGIIHVQAQPMHDVAVLHIDLYPDVAIQSQNVQIYVTVANLGPQRENISLVLYYESHIISNMSLTLQPGLAQRFVNWDTSNVRPGNYTVSATVYLATDQNLSNNSLSYGTVTILPPPTLTPMPTSGVPGTKVRVQVSGFQQGDQVFMSFDDQFLGFIVPVRSTFNFTFNVPLSDPTQPHSVNAFGVYSGARASAGFKVLAPPPQDVGLKISIDSAAIYFPGDTVVVYVQTTLNGQPVEATGLQIQVTLILPNGTSASMKTVSLTLGTFKATFTVSSSGSLGTYAVLVKAHSDTGSDASGLTTFEVKPTWINGRTMLTSALAIVGVVGVVGVGWWKGFFGKGDKARLDASESEGQL